MIKDREMKEKWQQLQRFGKRQREVPPREIWQEKERSDYSYRDLARDRQKCLLERFGKRQREVTTATEIWPEKEKSTARANLEKKKLSEKKCT